MSLGYSRPVRGNPHPVHIGEILPNVSGAWLALRHQTELCGCGGRIVVERGDSIPEAVAGHVREALHQAWSAATRLVL